MNRPSDVQFETALAEARRLREADEDVSSIGHVLLYLAHRGSYLEPVREAAQRYVHFGLGEAEHSRLLKALERADAEEARDGGDAEDLGLG